MSLKNFFQSSFLPPHRRHKSKHLIILIVLGGLIVILSSILIGLALIESAELVGYEDISLLEGRTPLWTIEFLYSGSLSFVLELGVFVSIMRLEYLRSHIGEKRIADAAGTNGFSLGARYLKTALVSRAVFCLFSALVRHLEHHPSYVVRPMSICATPFFKGNH